MGYTNFPWRKNNVTQEDIASDLNTTNRHLLISHTNKFDPTYGIFPLSGLDLKKKDGTKRFPNIENIHKCSNFDHCPKIINSEKIQNNS